MASSGTPRELSQDSTWGDQDVWRIGFPIASSGGAAIDSRLAAVYFPEKSCLCCFDLKHVPGSGKARVHAVIQIPESRNPPVMSLRNSMLAANTRIYDMSSGDLVRTIDTYLSDAACMPRSKVVSALDFNSEGKILALGAQSGCMHFLDLRVAKPVLSQVQSGIPLRISEVKWNRLIDSSLCSVQGDAVAVWDCRSMRSPISQLTAGGWKSSVSAIDWVGPGDLVINTVSEGLIRFSDISIDFLSNKRGILCSIPTDQGTGLVAFQSEPGRIDVIDPFSHRETAVVETFNTGACAVSLGYLEDARALVCADKKGLTIRSLAKHASAWSSKDGSSLMQSESSPRLHPVASHITASDQFLSDEMRAIHATFSLLSRRIRRMYLEADIEVDPDNALLEIGIPDPAGDRFKLKVAFRAEDGGMDKPTLSCECWWVRTEDSPSDHPIQDLPEIKQLEENFLNLVNLDDLVETGNMEPIMHAVQELKKFVATIDETEDSVVDELHAIPFPATCGICWSPNGDLFKFQSLKGLGPYPRHREKLTMKNFSKFNDIVASCSQAGTTNNSVAVHLNEFSEFREPLDDQENVNDDLLDEEFNQRVFTDGCVHNISASVFQNSVEDHWFALLAPLVDFSLPTETLFDRLIAFTKKAAHYNIVCECFELVKEFLNQPFTSKSALDVVRTTVLVDRLRFLYKNEQTQAVAIIAAVLINHHQFNREWDKQIYDSSLLLIHDHSVLFQRLGCFEASRVLEKIQALHNPLLPLLGSDPSKIGTVQSKPSCSVCGLTVHGLGNFCSKCGHGGHLRHVTISVGCSVKDCKCFCWQTPTPKLTVSQPVVVSTFISS
jgi:hypothetical protein